MTTQILLIDDDDNVRFTVGTYLRMFFGFSVAEARHGADALQWIEQHGDPGVILTDMRMPVMNGPKFMQNYNGSAPIIIVSGSLGDFPLPYRPFAQLQKPVDYAELKTLIDAALELSSPMPGAAAHVG